MKHESSIGILSHWVLMLSICFGFVLGVRYLRPDVFGIVYVLNSYPVEYRLFMAFYIMVPVSMSYITVDLVGKLVDHIYGILTADREG